MDLLTRMDEISDELGRITTHSTPTNTQVARVAELNEEFNRLDRAHQLERIRSAAAAGHIESGTPPAQPDPPARQGPFGDVRSAALRAIDGRRDAPEHARHRVAGLLDRANGVELDMAARWTTVTINPAYERAAGKLFRDPLNGHREFTGEELAAYREAKSVQRAMNLTDAAGGFLVPFTLDPNIMLTGPGSVNPLRSLARVVTTATESWSGVTSAGTTASWYAEAAEVADNSPTLAQPTIATHRASSFIAASIEVAMDSNLATQLGALFTDAKDQLEATAMTLGTGTGQPKGIIPAVSAVAGSVVAAAGGALTVADIYANQGALPPRWRPRAQWLANLSIINAGRQLVAGTGLTTAIVDDSTTPPRMLGWRLHENSVMDGTIGAGNDYVLLSGDFSQYALVDRLGAVVEHLPLLLGPNRRPTGERGWFMYWRVGADVLVPDAFRLTNYSA